MMASVSVFSPRIVKVAELFPTGQKPDGAAALLGWQRKFGRPVAVATENVRPMSSGLAEATVTPVSETSRKSVLPKMIVPAMTPELGVNVKGSDAGAEERTGIPPCTK